MPRIYALTWTIPEDFGGLTSVLLHRSGALARAGAAVEILTLAPDLDVKGTTRRLRAAGVLDRKVRLRNAYEELRSMPERHARTLAEGAGRPSAPEPRPRPFDGRPRVVAGGQADTFRSNGRVVLTDESSPSRRITLWDRKGAPLAEWTRARDLYFAWLDLVIGGREAYLVNDSQFVGGFLADYQRPHVTLAQVIHSAHLADETAGVHGPLLAGKFSYLLELDRFDLVAPLTSRQADDLRAAHLVGGESLVAIPNSRNVSDRPPSPRVATAGVVVSRLSPEKRLDHAIDAFSAARTRLPELTLDVYGSGPERESLEARGAADGVTFKGYDPRAAQAFEGASFSLLTSRSEGMGLVLVESMAAGCLPIAYDIRYGPSDIITDGVDGFLVPSGDVAALTATIERVASLDEATLAAMREAAVRRGRDFGDGPVVREWLAQLERARERQRPPETRPGARAGLEDVTFEDASAVVRVSARGPAALAEDRVFLSWRGRKVPVYGRSPASPVGESGERDAGVFAWEARIPLAEIDAEILDLSLDFVSGQSLTRVRLAAGPEVSGRAWASYSTVKGNASLRREREATPVG